jgi:hypothetical protein
MTSIPTVNSLFEQPWWLEAVAPNNWQVAEVEVNGTVRARLPYYLSCGFGGSKLITMPPLTPWLGPWLAPRKSKYAKALAQEKDLINALIDQLPAHDEFRHNFHYSFTNWLPFYWRSFSATVRYTYVLDDLTDPERLWAAFLDNIRTDIKKAQKILTVKQDLDLERFLDINALTFQRQRRSLPYNHALVRRLDEACRARRSREIFYAEDAQGRIHAVLYLVWDENSAFYLMGGADPALRNSGAMSLLVWESIQYAATVTRKYDFEGSMIEPVERFFRAFGAVQTPYFQISKISRRGKVLNAARNLLNRLRQANGKRNR